MSKLAKTNLDNTASMESVISNVHTEMQTLGEEDALHGVSVESFGTIDANVQNDAQARYDSAYVALEAAFGKGVDIDGVLVKPSAQGLEAAAIIGMWGGKQLGEFARTAMRHNNPSVEGVTTLTPILSGGHGTLDARFEASFESFDNSKLTDFRTSSYILNALAATQDDFAEAHFKTVVMTPDEPGLEIVVSQPTVMNEVRRSLLGDETDFGKKTLTQAKRDASILQNATIELIPVVAADNSNAAKFIPDAIVPNEELEVGGAKVTTNFLKITERGDLMALCMGGAHVSGDIANSTDSIDRGVSISKLLVEITNKAGDATSHVVLDVAGLPGTGSYKSHEGTSRDVKFSFEHRGFAFNKNTKDVDNAAVAALASLNATDNVARIDLAIYGGLNLERGGYNFTVAAPSVVSVVNQDGARLALDSGVGKTIAEDFNVTVIGIKLAGTRSNKTRRTRGVILDRETKTFRYDVPMGSPFTLLTPPGETPSAADMKDLISTTRVRTSNNAVTAILNYAEMLKTQVSVAQDSKLPVLIEGAGAELIDTPYFKEVELDIQARVTSEKSHEMREDIAALIVDTIRAEAYEAAEKSGYNAALSIASMGQTPKPFLNIGTDETLPQHMMVSGDERTLGIKMNHRVVSTSDTRYEDTITLTFGRPNSNGADALSFGTHAYMPELIGEVQVSDGNGVLTEVQAQSRSVHIPHLPVMVVIKIKNLEETLAGAK